jgi:hypothetical protein
VGVVALLGCAHSAVVTPRAARPRPVVDDPELATRLPALEHQLGHSSDRDGAWLVAYDVEAHDGRWRHEIAFTHERYAEQHTRLDPESAGSYAFGVDPWGAWLRVGDGPVRAADAHWEREARTRAAIFRLDFLAPREGDEALYLPRSDAAWDYVYRPHRGRSLTFLVDPGRGAPIAWDVLDELGRLAICEDVTWATLRGRRVPGRGRCFTPVGPGQSAPHAVASFFHVRSLSLVQALPSWVAPSERRAHAPCLAQHVTIPMEDELEVHVPVEASPPRMRERSAGASARFLLDSGAWHTYVDEDAAARLGIVPTGEPPFYAEPAWLPADTAWVGVADRLSVAGIPLDGARVFVIDGLAQHVGADGLLGADFFRRFVVDIDAPARVVRIWPHDGFEAPAGAAGFVMSSTQSTARIVGEVSGIERGAIALDTGAPVRLVVSSPRMAAVRPRRRGTAIGPTTGDSVLSPDYLSSVDGLVLGPFVFPEIPAWGRDRERARLGEGIGLIGMGTMRHLRMMFDLRNRQLHARAGPSFDVLWRAGLELDDAETGAEVTHALPGSPAYSRGVRTGDVLVGIEGVPVRDALRARRLLSSHRGGAVRLMFLRRGYPRTVDVALDLPPDTNDPFRTSLEPPDPPPGGSGCTNHGP